MLYSVDAIDVAYFTAKSASGTCTATLKINGVAITNGALSVSSSISSTSPSGLFSLIAGDTLTLTISSSSSCVDMAFFIGINYTLVD